MPVEEAMHNAILERIRELGAGIGQDRPVPDVRTRGASVALWAPPWPDVAQSYRIGTTRGGVSAHVNGSGTSMAGT